MAKHRILIVEDEALVAKDIENKLTQAGYQAIARAASGEEAIQLARVQEPDLILMDIRLSGEIDGIQAAAQISAFLSVPVIYLTAYADQETLQRAKITSPYNYIVKPFEGHELLVNIEMALHKHAGDIKITQSEARYRGLFQASSVGIAMLDPDGVIIDCNDKALEITGCSRKDLLGKASLEVGLITVDELQQLIGLFQRALLGEQGNHQKQKLIRPDGSFCWVDLLISPLRDETGIFAVQVIARDVTEQILAEIRLQESLQTSVDIVNASPSGLFIYQYQAPDKLYLLDGNPAAEELTGLKIADFIGKEFNEIWPQAQATGVTQSYLQVIETGETYQSDDMFYTDERLSGTFRVRVFLMPSQRLGVSFENITEQKQSEQTLEKRAAQLALLNTISNQITAALNIDDILDRAAQLAHSYFDYHHVGIFRFNESKRVLEMVARAGDDADRYPPNHQLRLDQGIVGWVANHMQSKLVKHVAADPQYVNLYPAVISSLSELSVPIQMEARLLGVLDLQSPSAAAFDNNDLMVAETLAGQIAVAWENARLYQDLKQELVERTHAQEELRDQRNRAQKYLDIAGVLLLVLDRKGNIVLLNKRGYQILGYEEGSLQGQNWFCTCLPEGIRAEIENVFTRLMSGETDQWGIEYNENSILTQTGKERVIAWHNTVLNNDVGEIIGTLSSGEDITDRIKANTALQESEARYRLLVENQNDLIIKTDTDYRLTFVSPSYCQIFDKAETDLLGQSFLPTIHEADRESVLRSMGSLSQPPHTAYHEERLLIEDGWRWFGWSARGIRDQAGKIFEIISVGRDITERVQATEALAQAAAINAQIAQLSENLLTAENIVAIARFTLDTALRLTGSVMGYADYFDPETGTLISPTIVDTLGDQPQGVKQVLETCIELCGWGPDHLNPVLSNDLANDLRFTSNSSGLLPIERFLAVPVLHGGRKGLLVLANSHREYTDNDLILLERLAVIYALGVQRKLAEEQTRQRAAELEAIQQVSTAMRAAKTSEEIWPVVLKQVAGLFDAEGAAFGTMNTPERKVYINQGIGIWENRVGTYIPLDEGITGQVITTGKAFLSSKEQQDLIFAEINGSGSVSFAACVPLKTQIDIIGVLWMGKNKPITADQLSLLSAIGDLTATAIHRQSLYHNLQEQLLSLRKTQDRLIQSEKLAAIGELTAGVAHELNNPLTAILLYADMLQQNSLSNKIVSDLQKITTEARRSAKIVRGLLDFSRQRAPERHPIQINEVITDSLELVGYELNSHGIRWELSLDIDLPVTMADPHQLQQVFVNLFTNAWHAINSVSDSGLLSIQTEVSPRSLHGLNNNLDPMILISIADTGPGIDSDHARRVFDPFFTTKLEGKGSGLGLSICHGIIMEHGGNIWVESKPGQGANFYIELPILTPSDTGRLIASAPAAAKKIGCASILLIDDEPAVLDIVTRIIQRAGHQVDAVASGTQAFDLLANTNYDLILCDVHMPNLSGMSLYRLLEQEYPHLLQKIVFTTGDSVSRSTRYFLDEVGVPYLYKPFEKETLITLIQKMLNR